MSKLTPPVFAILGSLIEERTGIHYDVDDAVILGDKVTARAEAAGFESLLDYYYFLRYDDADGAEFRALTAALVVHESYFFREYDQLLAVVDRFLVPAIRDGKRPRVWSAACAGGEEPLSIAMMLAERDLDGKADILATDISERVLARARENSFGKRALRDPPALAARFVGEHDGRLRVDARVHAQITWSQQNLVDVGSVASRGTFDVILCKNVLIYFSDAAVGRVIEALRDRLAPDGALFVGVSESLLRFGTGLVCEEQRGVFYYRRTS